MYAYIKGTLIQISATSVILEAGGIGYKLLVPVSIFSHLPQTTSPLTLHTSFVVRELSQTLYGFFNVQERDFFEMLLGVTGIGPKIALALIGHMPPQELQKAICSEDTTTLCRIPGIGKKSAERLIIEMRDKVETILSSSVSQGEFSTYCLTDPYAQTVKDAISALINLGYNQNIAQKAIKKSLKDIPDAIDVASLISSALKHV